MALNQQRRSMYQRPQVSLNDPIVTSVEVAEPDPRITGTWSSADTERDDQPDQVVIDTDFDAESEPVKTSPFVRVVHGQVGMYPYGSVVAASTFEYLTNLLDLGAIEYDYEATQQSITGNPEHLATVSGVLSAAMQTIPNAPWASAAAHNLLGAHYLSVLKSRQTWTMPSIEPTVTLPGD